MVGILIDMNMFWAYENRESYSPPEESASEGG